MIIDESLSYGSCRFKRSWGNGISKTLDSSSDDPYVYNSLSNSKMYVMLKSLVFKNNNKILEDLSYETNDAVLLLDFEYNPPVL